MREYREEKSCMTCKFGWLGADEPYPCRECVRVPTEWKPIGNKADLKTEPQYDFGDYADRLWKIAYERGKREALEQTEPQTDCNGCKFVGTYDTEFPCANCSRKTKDYYAKDEPQTERNE